MTVIVHAAFQLSGASALCDSRRERAELVLDRRAHQRDRHSDSDRDRHLVSGADRLLSSVLSYSRDSRRGRLGGGSAAGQLIPSSPDGCLIPSGRQQFSSFPCWPGEEPNIHLDSRPESQFDNRRAVATGVSWPPLPARSSSLADPHSISFPQPDPILASVCIGNIGAQPDVGFDGLCLQDSPLGVRRSDFNSVFPAGVNVASTFDRGLMYARGLAMGEEFKGKGVNVALGPGMNPYRAVSRTYSTWTWTRD
jgi:hypothetical protein